MKSRWKVFDEWLSRITNLSNIFGVFVIGGTGLYIACLTYVRPSVTPDSQARPGSGNRSQAVRPSPPSVGGKLPTTSTTAASAPSPGLETKDGVQQLLQQASTERDTGQYLQAKKTLKQALLVKMDDLPVWKEYTNVCALRDTQERDAGISNHRANLKDWLAGLGQVRRLQRLQGDAPGVAEKTQEFISRIKVLLNREEA